MTFQESIRVCFTKYADFGGRAMRSEYWWWVLFTIVVGIALALVSHLVAGLFHLAVLIPSLAVAVRRLHDTGKSGWWLLIGLIPLIGAIVLIIFFIQPGTGESSPPAAAA